MNEHAQNIPQPQKKKSPWHRNSITLRLLVVGVLTLLLMIPLALVQNLIEEREERQQEVVSELNSKWGNEILLYGPILKVPYKTYEETIKYDQQTKKNYTEVKTIMNHAYFFPEELNYDANVKTLAKKRNNFDSAVFTATIHATGNFDIPDFSAHQINPEDVVWDKATLVIKSTNLKGLKSKMNVTLNEAAYDFETNFTQVTTHINPLDELESTPLQVSDVPKDGKKSFNFTLQYNGSEKVQFVPIGKVTNVVMTSDWKDPSHVGDFITQQEEQTENGGFTARWKLLHTNRPFSQQFFKDIPNLSIYAFGTKFIVQLDEYQKSERSAKYGFLVIGLTFLCFFLIQTLSNISIHPFQYLMIGIALVMFYTLLISISEHSSFLKAYVIAGISVITMITLYTKSVLKRWKFSLFVGTSLTVLYGFIFVIIQLENYALLAGSIGLFAILGIVMYVSRKIDWQHA